VILVDTSGVLALYDRADLRQPRVVEALKGAGVRILSPFVLAELGYLVPRFGGQPAELALLEDVPVRHFSWSRCWPVIWRWLADSSISTLTFNSVWRMRRSWCWPSGTAASMS